MKNHLLSIPERVFVEEARANTRDKGAYMKLSVLVMLDEGFTHDLVATALGIGIGTVGNCRGKYEKEGLDKFLDRHYVPYQGRLDNDQLLALEDELNKNLYASCKQIGTWIEDQFEIQYSESAIRSILRKLGYAYKKTSEVPCKSNFKDQSEFLAQMVPFIAETDESEESVYFMDAVHPQHNTRSDYAWIKRGEERTILTNTGRQRVNINGAMNALHPQEVIVHEAETINAQSTIELLKKLLDKNRDKSQIYIFCDNAPYYYCKVLQEWLALNPKIMLLHLPPYSPNLNLIERLWKFLRKKIINLRFYPNFKDFKETILNFFEHIEKYKDELKTLMAPNFQLFSV